MLRGSRPTKCEVGGACKPLRFWLFDVRKTESLSVARTAVKTSGALNFGGVNNARGSHCCEIARVGALTVKDTLKQLRALAMSTDKRSGEG